MIVTGRVVDSAIVLGPLVYEFGWSWRDYDKLGGASLAGHIIECACQCTGGNFTDWEDSLGGGWDNVGYPIVECFSDSSFIVTKPKNSGGIVTRGTVLEQMLYEIGDPSSYFLPDVTLDFRNVSVKELPPLKGEKWSNRVYVEGAKGKPPSPFYKVSSTSSNGYKLSLQLLIGGLHARKKALAVGESLFKRVDRLFSLYSLPPFSSKNLETLGSEHRYLPPPFLLLLLFPLPFSPSFPLLFSFSFFSLSPFLLLFPLSLFFYFPFFYSLSLLSFNDTYPFSSFV